MSLLGMDTVTLSLKALGTFSDEEFYRFCLDNPQWKFERTAEGQISIMPNTGGITGKINAEIIFQLMSWNKTQKSGVVFDSSTAFRLPNSSVRSPDAAFIRIERWNALTETQKKQFPPVCPDFVIELRSESDSLKDLQKKMQEEWLGNGCQLGWLIDVQHETAYIYRPNQEPKLVSGFTSHLSGEMVLPGFEFDLSELRTVV